MPNLTTVGITSGVPSSGTGTVSTIDNMFTAAGTPSSNVQTVQFSTTLNSTANPVVVTISSAIAAVTSITSGTVYISTANATFVGGSITVPSYNFTRPSDTTAYASGDLVANSSVNTSVTPMSWSVARISGGQVFVRRIRLTKSTTTTANANFRVHLYTTSPSSITNGDNGAWLTSGSTSYVGALDVSMGQTFSDGADGIGTPNNGSEISIITSSQTIYGLIEARSSYTPGSSEVFNCLPEVYQF